VLAFGLGAYFHHFGNMTHSPGIGKFCVVLPEIGNFFLHFWGIESLSTISGLKKQMIPD
jgi:hypothetical protein